MKLITSILSILALSFTLQAADEAKKPEGEKPKQDPAKYFAKIDANSDGSISLDEMKASPAGKKDEAKAEATFKKKDKDSDGKLTMEEFTAGGKKKKE